MVPFIMASNIALAGIFLLLEKTNYWVAALAASFAKFIFLVVSANIVLNLLSYDKMTPVLASMMGWPQLITALLGAIAAYGIKSKMKNQS
jgi:hypothetical protein